MSQMPGIGGKPKFTVVAASGEFPNQTGALSHPLRLRSEEPPTGALLVIKELMARKICHSLGLKFR